MDVFKSTFLKVLSNIPTNPILKLVLESIDGRF